MSRFQKLSHVIWHCQYHIVGVPKYRYKVLKGKLGEEPLLSNRNDWVAKL
jgi:putative transposase